MPSSAANELNSATAAAASLPAGTHSMRWKNSPASMSRCWSACRMLPDRAKIHPAVFATMPGWSGPCNRATSVAGDFTRTPLHRHDAALVELQRADIDELGLHRADAVD